jgi:signal transduction histidine kinase/ActR/RegA family two-component response regulator
VTQELLRHATVSSASCEDAQSMAVQFAAGAGALLLTDAVFSDVHFDQLLMALNRQPPWSDVPVLLLCHTVPPTTVSSRVLDSLRNATVLERPASARTLLSSVQAALRARARQYQLREQIEALRASEQALRDADRRKDSFLATLAHELRNPLAPIRTAAQILGSQRLEPQQLHWAQQVIQRQVAHMALLLDDLLDIARITQGKLELKMERVRLTEIVDAAVETARPLLDSKHHQLTVTLPSEQLVLQTDPVRLSQILSNLLTNAAKYTDPAGHIELSGGVQNDTLCLSVKDDGIGIAPEALTKIFDMFSQIDSASVRAEGGLGIGLALVKGLLELHGGTIEATSEGLGQGSKFTVHVPLVASTPTQKRASGADTPPLATAGRRVMVADDNTDAAEALAMLLELAGHEVRVAHGGRAALAIAQTFRPDVALLDIGMPDLSGYEVAKELRRLSWGAGICLVALTGWGRDDDRQRAMVAGFDRHLTKPIDAGALQALLAKETEESARMRRRAVSKVNTSGAD